MKRFICAALVAVCTASAAMLGGCAVGEATVDYELSEDGTYYIVSGVSGDNRGLTSYEIPAQYAQEEGGALLPVKEIGAGAFITCKLLNSIVIPDSVVTIGRNAFTRCGLTSVTIPDSVTTIGFGAFGACDRLTEVTVPASVTKMDGHVFYGCSKLEKAYVNANIEVLPENTFTNFAYAEAGNAIINSALTTVYLPSTLKKIHASAFDNDYYLADIYFAGTKAQWSALYFYYLSKKEGTENEYEEVKVDKSEVLNSGVKVHCADD